MIKPNARQLLAQIIVHEACLQNIGDTITSILGEDEAMRLANAMINNYGYDKERIYDEAAKIKVDEIGWVDSRQWDIEVKVNKR